MKNIISGTTYLKLTANEALELAYNCHKVLALRSGFCDLCVSIGNRLTVLYPNKKIYKNFSLKKIWGNSDPEEIIYTPKFIYKLLDIYSIIKRTVVNISKTFWIKYII